MTAEEYKEKVICMLEDINDTDNLKKIYTVTKVVHESQQKE